jgi:crotonyl-CoA carboxylase/reductase
MLHGWPPNTVTEGDVVLVWGGAGGLGSLAIQLVTLAGGRAVAVVSSEEKAAYCRDLGAIGTVDRTAFDHWGVPPAWDSPDWKAWLDGAKAFGKAIWDAVGERTNPAIVFEHPGQDTIPTSNFVCDRGGMIVICAGTTGFDTMIDVRYLWYLQKRYQGSHLFNDQQAAAFNDLVRAGAVRTTLGRTYRYDEAAGAHQLMGHGELPEGNVSVLVGAPTTGLRDLL